MSFIQKFFTSTNIKFDLDKALKDLHLILQKYPFNDQRKQISLTHPSPVNQSIEDGTGSLFNFEKQIWTSYNDDYKYFSEEFKETYFYEMYTSLNEKAGGRIRRIRLMNLPPKTCYSMHVDSTIRYHFALKTNPNAFLVFKEGAVIHVPTDGLVYAVDTRRFHSAMNGSDTDNRIHLVFAESEHSKP